MVTKKLFFFSSFDIKIYIFLLPKAISKEEKKNNFLVTIPLTDDNLNYPGNRTG